MASNPFHRQELSEAERQERSARAAQLKGGHLGSGRAPIAAER